MKFITKYIAKYKSMPIGAKAAAWYTICNLLQKGIMFIVVPIYTRMLTTSEYGTYTIFQSWKDIIIIFTTLNLYCGVFTRGLVKYEEDRNKYVSSIQVLSTAVTLFVCTILFIFFDTINNVWQVDKKVFILLFVYYLFSPSIQFWSVKQRVENKYIKMVVVTVLLSLVTPIISIGLLVMTDMRENALIYGYLLVQIAFGFIFYVDNLFKGKLKVKFDYCKEALTFNIPLIPHYLSLIVLNQSDRIMIDNYCGKAEAGIYSLTYSVSQILNIFIGAINGSMVPWQYEKMKKKEFAIIGKVSNILCLGIGICSILVIAIGPEIIYIMGGKEYTEAIWCIPPIVMGIYFTFCYGLFSTVEFYHGVTKFIAVASTVGAVLNVLLNALCIPVFGYIAAAYTTLICYIMFAIAHYVIMRKVTKEKIYIMKDMLLVSCILVVLQIAFTFSYYYAIIRAIMLAILVIGTFVKRNYFIECIKSIRR